MQENCVLIVEDSPTMRHLISFALRRVPDLTFIEAENGAEGLELLKQYPIKLILLDINMPVMSGFTFLEGMQELDEENRPPVIVITTEGSQEDVERALSLGAKAYVTKPVQSANLTQTVKDVLNQYGAKASSAR